MTLPIPKQKGSNPEGKLIREKPLNLVYLKNEFELENLWPFWSQFTLGNEHFDQIHLVDALAGGRPQSLTP